MFAIKLPEEIENRLAELAAKTPNRVNGRLEPMSTKTVTQEHRATGVTTTAPWRVRSVTVLPSYCLSVTCNDGTTGIVDMSRLISSEQAGIFAALQDEKLFNQVRIELGALTWSNGADLDPEWLHEEIGKNKMWCVPR